MLNSSALIEDLHTLTMFTFSLVGIDLISDTITNNKVMTHKKEFFTTKFRAYIYIYIYMVAYYVHYLQHSQMYKPG